MENRFDQVLKDDFFKIFEELHLNTQQEFDAIYYILFESTDDPVYELLNITKDNFPILQESDDPISCFRRLIVMMILNDFVFLKSQKMLQKLLEKQV